MRRLSVFAIILLALLGFVSCNESDNTTLKASKVTIDGSQSKDIFVVDSVYPLDIVESETDAGSMHIALNISFSLVNPIENSTCDPRVEILDGNNVVCTMKFGQDAGDQAIKEQFSVYIVGHAQRVFEAPFYYNTDDALEVESIRKNAKTFRIVNMFMK